MDKGVDVLGTHMVDVWLTQKSPAGLVRGFWVVLGKSVGVLPDGELGSLDPPCDCHAVDVWDRDRVTDLLEARLERAEVEVPITPVQFDAEVLDGAVHLQDRPCRVVRRRGAWAPPGFTILSARLCLCFRLPRVRQLS